MINIEENNLCQIWDLNLRSSVLSTDTLPLNHLRYCTYTKSKTNLFPCIFSTRYYQNGLGPTGINNSKLENLTSGYDLIYMFTRSPSSKIAFLLKFLYIDVHTRDVHTVSFPGAVYRNRTKFNGKIYWNRYSM